MKEDIKVKKRTNFIDRTGEKHITNEGFLIEIIECINSKNITVRFEDGEVVKNKYYYDRFYNILCCNNYMVFIYTLQK